MSEYRIFIGRVTDPTRGRWVDLTKNDAAEVEAVATTIAGATGAEVFVAESEGAWPECIGGAISAHVDYYAKVKELDSADPEELIAAWCDYLTEVPEDLTGFSAAFQGVRQSLAEFAQEFALSVGLIPQNVPWPLEYIDWHEAWDGLEDEGWWFERLSDEAVGIFSPTTELPPFSTERKMTNVETDI